MNCPWCSNINYLTDSTCAHCGEVLSPGPVPEPGRQFARPVKTHARSGARDRFFAVWKTCAVSAAAVAVLAAGGVSTFHRWPVTESLQLVPQPTPTPSASPQDQVIAMNALLLTIKATRSELPDTLGSCTSVSSDLEILERVVQERSGQVTEATNLRTDTLSGGAALKTALIDMTDKTLAADQAYLEWAQNADAFCTDVSQDGDLGQANQKAADAKRDFLKLWKPVAVSFKEPKYAWRDF